MKTMEILIGVIASGKSTYCHRKLNNPLWQDEKWLCINDDALVTMLHGGDYGKYDESLKAFYKGLEMTTAIAIMQAGHNLIVDKALNLTRASRLKWVNIAKAMNYEPVYVLFNFEDPLIHATRRMNDDPRGHDEDYWLNVAKAQIERFEELNRDELNLVSSVHAGTVQTKTLGKT